ncbi:MAG: carboxypeptidase regulatory-like domain-containing protein [Rhodobacteraceae bacterium]|nr:MAG: carboxypeptidase regulatory-like domain-containing protein [Paracoccaceae bacterium]
MIGRSDRAALALAAATAFAPPQALGHAALIEAEATTAISLRAHYDTGEPMAEAQVVVYAPDDPARAWARGVTDGDGRFVFAPDLGAPGRWTVQVRQAGHGAVAHVDIGEAEAATGREPLAVASVGAGGAPGILTQAVMVALVAWGALGTALYFRRGRRDDASA